jgi:hypothetical protein
MPVVRNKIAESVQYVCGLTIKFANSDIRGIVHYEFVPTGQSTKFTIWKY